MSDSPGVASDLVGSRNRPAPVGLDALELSIVLPCLNEAETLGTCLSKAMGVLRDREIRGEVIVADNGSSWYLSGATDSRWNDNNLNELKSVPGSAFQVVETGPILH